MDQFHAAGIKLDVTERDLLRSLLDDTRSFGERAFRTASPDFSLSGAGLHPVLTVSLQQREVSSLGPGGEQTCVAFLTETAASTLRLGLERARRRLRDRWLSSLLQEERTALAASVAGLKRSGRLPERL